MTMESENIYYKILRKWAKKQLKKKLGSFKENDYIQASDFFLALFPHPNANIEQKLKKDWSEILPRWGTCYFASVLKNPAIPDYFAYHGESKIQSSRTTIMEVWDNEIKPHLVKIYNGCFFDLEGLIHPKLSLIVYRSPNLVDARLSRYYLSEDIQEYLLEDIQKVTKCRSYDQKLLTSRYWELLATVGAHLLGRNHFLTELRKMGKINKLLISISDDEQENQKSPIRFRENYSTCFISKHFALSFGSNCENSSRSCTETPLYREAVKEIQKKIQSLCFDEMCEMFINCEHKVAEDEVRNEIARIAIDISRAIRNGRYTNSGKSFTFKEIRFRCVEYVMAMVFNSAEEGINDINKLLKWFRSEKNELKNKSARMQLFEQREALRMLLLSFFDVFIFAPWCKSLLLYYEYINSEVSAVWAILGTKSIRKSDLETFISIKAHKSASVAMKEFSGGPQKNESGKSFDKQYFIEVAPKLVHALNKSKNIEKIKDFFSFGGKKDAK